MKQATETFFETAQAQNLFSDYMSKPDLQELVSVWLGNQVYDRLGGSRISVPQR